MSDPADARDALARLAARSGDRLARADGAGVFSRRSRDYRQVVDDAEAATTTLTRAAEFVKTTGLESLESAITTATEADDHAAARRGREALRTFEAFRAACAGTGDQFHSGRTTDLGSGVEGGFK